MPKFHEVFGVKASTLHDDMNLIKSALCPFTSCTCDGGGNRHQTTLRLAPDDPLRDIFSDTLSTLVPAVCSVDYGSEQWVVCPRRLMGFKAATAEIPEANFSLQPHERQVLEEVGLLPNIDYGIWSEIYLKYSIADTEIDYHFDFVIAPILIDVPVSSLREQFDLSESEVLEVIKICKTSKNLISSGSEQKLKIMPDLKNPIIIEVMTASTSGSNTIAGTNIASAFRRLLLGEAYQGPGINKRQVWGRMATQLLAKSALAEHWGGKTFWLVQDQLLRNIELTTQLRMTPAAPDACETVNFISLEYTADSPAQLVLNRAIRLASGISFSGNSTCSDILLPKAYPPKQWLLKSILRRGLSGIVKL